MKYTYDGKDNLLITEMILLASCNVCKQFFFPLYIPIFSIFKMILPSTTLNNSLPLPTVTKIPSGVKTKKLKIHFILNKADLY